MRFNPKFIARTCLFTFLLTFTVSSPLRAEDATTLRDSVIRNLFMIIGYPTVARYLEMTGCTQAQVDADTCDAEPVNGMIGIVKTVMAQIESVLTSQAGITACSGIGTSGNYSVTDDDFGAIIVTLGTPVKVIPTGHTGADGTTKYAKRISMTSGGVNFGVIEFECDTTQGYFAVNFGADGPSSDNASNRIIEFYFDNASTGVVADFFMRHDPTNERMATHLTTDNSAQTFAYIMVRVSGSGVSFNANRMSVNGTFTSGSRKATALIGDIDGTSLANVAANAQAASTAVTNDEGNGRYLFCVESGKTPVFGTACSGIALTANTDTPAIGSSADSVDKWTIEWVADATNGLLADLWDPSE